MRWLALAALLLGCGAAGPGFAEGDAGDDDTGDDGDDDSGDDDSGDDDPACARGEQECPWLACSEPGAPSGRTWLGTPDDPWEGWCAQDVEGGGWTLLLVSSDDGQETWTWDRRDLWAADGASLGDLDERDRDLRSPALGLLPIGALLFVHRPSDVTARYDLGGAGTLGQRLAAPEADCDPVGVPLAGGSLDPDAPGLCDSDLYLNPADLDGASCGVPEPHRSDAWGPAWSVGGNDGCPLDDPGEASSLGPSSLEDPSLEYGAAAPAVGFGRALGLNTQPGTRDRMEVWGR